MNLSLRWIKYYLLFLGSTGITGLVSLLSILYLPNEIYGNYILYLSILSFTTIFSFGLQDYYRINYKDKLDYLNFRKIYNLIYKIQVVVLIVIFLMYLILNFDNINILIILVLLSIIPNNIAMGYKHIYLLTGKDEVYYSIDFINQISVFIGIILYINFSISVELFIAILLVFKLIILFYLEIYNKLKLTKILPPKTEKPIQINKNIFIYSFVYIIGFWLIINSSKIDILYASGNEDVLGSYSKIKSLAGLLILLFMPLTNMFFVSIKEDITESEKSNKYMVVLNSLFVMCLSYFVVISLFIGKFNVDISQNNFLLCIMFVNLLLPINVYIINLLMFNKKKLIFLGSLMFSVFLIFHTLNVLVFGLSVLSLSLINIFAINTINLVLIIKEFKNKKVLLIINNVILNIIYILLYSILL